MHYGLFGDGVHEARTAVGWAKDLIATGSAPRECAFLARSSKALANLEIALHGHRIPYVKYGGLALGDAVEVKDFLAFLRIALNPRDRLALLRVLLQFSGVGESAASRVMERVIERKGFAHEDVPEVCAGLVDLIPALASAKKIGDAGEQLFEFIKPLVLANHPKDGPERLGTLETMVKSMATEDGTLEDFLDGFALDRG